MQSQRKNTQKLTRLEVGAIPVLDKVSETIGLKQLLEQGVPTHGNEKIPVSESLMILLKNISLGRYPLYEIENWFQKHHPGCFETHGEGKLNDDRFGRALDKLFRADRASLMTEIVVRAIHLFEIDVSEIHNDTTSVKAHGKYPGETSTGFKLERGYSKDHRPDLKQLVFSLSVSADGSVPIHYKAYPGNQSDAKTHIETWKAICSITGKHDFLYVADSKVCTREQLDYIVNHGGRVLTIVPETWRAGRTLRDELRKGKQKSKKVIWRRPVPGDEMEQEYFSVFSGEYKTESGYTIYWIYSSEKRKRDRAKREAALNETERDLSKIMARLNTRKLKTKEQIHNTVDKALEKHSTKRFYHVQIRKVTERESKQIGRGRPGPNTRYQVKHHSVYSLSWTRNKKTIHQEKHADGVFPLLTTDPSVGAKQALQAYKYQPKLEKRFTQFKSIHAAAPLLFKKVERVESIMFLYFVSLLVQTLIEREVRNKMKSRKLAYLAVYPEDRISKSPTTSKILDRFDGVSVYHLWKRSKKEGAFRDELDTVQRQILRLLNIPQSEYWPE